MSDNGIMLMVICGLLFMALDALWALKSGRISNSPVFILAAIVLLVIAAIEIK